MNKVSKKFVLIGYIFSLGIFLGSSAGIARDYQDSWILENLFIQFAFLVIFYFLLIFFERRNEYVALATGIFIFALRLSVGLKYDYMYGTALDQGFHLANLSTLLQLGSLTPNNIYADTPGVYILFTSLKLFFVNISASDLLRFGPAFLFFILPLSIFMFGKALSFPDPMLRFSILGSVLSLDPYFFTLQGGTIGAVLFLIIYLAILFRSSLPGPGRVISSIFIIVELFNLIITHAITSFFAISIIIILGLFELLLKRVHKGSSLDLAHQSKSLILGSGLVGFVLLFAWWMYRANGVFTTIVQKAASLITNFSNPIKLPIPIKFLNLSFVDQIIIILLYHADIIVFVGLSLLGMLFVFLHYRRKRIYINYQVQSSMVILILLSVILVLFALKIGVIEYFRLFGYIAVLAPILIGLLFYSLIVILRRFMGSFNINIIPSILFLLLLIFTFIQVFPYQPMIPKVERTTQSIQFEEPIVFLHTVVTNYQLDMLDFAKTRIDPGIRVGADIVTYNVAQCIWGLNTMQTIKLERAVQNRPIDQGKWQILLTHNSGFAGPLFEAAEYRYFIPPNQYSPSEGFNLVYNNGGSFIITR